MQRYLVGAIIALFSIAFWAEAQAPVVYDGSQLLRGRKGRVVYNIVGGEFDGKRGYLFRIANQSDAPVILDTIPDSFSEPVLGFLSNGSALSDGTASFEGRTLPSEVLFDGGTEILNVSPTTEDEDRPFNFIVVVEPTVDELIWFFRGREKRARIANSVVETLDLSGPGGVFNVQVQFTYDEGSFDGSGEANYSIDGVETGAIPLGGMVEVELPAGTHIISGVNEFAAGAAEIDVSSSGMNEVEVILKSYGLSRLAEYELQLSSASDGIIQPTASSITLGFFDPNGAPIELADNPTIFVHRIEPGSFKNGYGKPVSRVLDLGDDFVVQSNGLIEASNPQDVIAQITAIGSGPYMFEIRGVGSAIELPLVSAIEFRIARHSVNGTILKLPDSPTYNFTDIVVEARSPRTGVIVAANANSAGAFDFGQLPSGPYDISVSLQVGDEFITSSGQIDLQNDTVLEITPITFAQALNAEEEFSIVSSVNLNSSQSISSFQLSSLQQSPLATVRQNTTDMWPNTLMNTGVPLIDPASLQSAPDNQAAAATLNLPVTNSFQTGAGSGERISETRLIEVSPALDFFGFAYLVNLFIGVEGGGGSSSWAINVRDQSGQILFTRSNVFSTSIGPPLARPFVPSSQFEFSSGVVGETVSLPPITPPFDPNTDRSIAVTLRVSTSDINETAGDITFAYVNLPFAVAQPEPTVELGVERAAVPQSDAEGWRDPETGVQRRPEIDGDTVSIPNTGIRNTFDFRLPVQVKRLDLEENNLLTSADVTSASLQLEYIGAGGNPTDIFQGSVTQLSDRNNNIEVQAAFVDPNPQSPISTVPPATELVKYTITLDVNVDGNTQQVETSFTDLIGLYVTQDNLIDYLHDRPQDEGGDKWTHPLLWEYLQDNGDLFSEINDISGEHGVDLGHISHKQGLDIDTRFYVNVDPGGGVFRWLRRTAILAIRGDQAAISSVTTFISDQHTGLQAVADTGDLNLVYGPIGWRRFTEPNPPPGMDPIVLPSNWAEELFEDGTITDDQGVVVLDIGQSMSTELKRLYHPDAGHEDHYHFDFQENDLN